MHSAPERVYPRDSKVLIRVKKPEQYLYHPESARRYVNMGANDNYIAEFAREKKQKEA